VLYIYVEAPSLEELKQRLLSRNTEPLETIQLRLATAEKDAKLIRESSEKLFDLVLINGDLEQTYRELQSHLDTFLS
jgi:guanylate kinase